MPSFKSWSLSFLLILAVLLPASAQDSPITFLAEFENDPTTPTSWNPDNWDVTVHLRSRDHYQAIHTMEADHGPDCGPPPATHTITTYEETVYNCKNHLMTAINGPGYGAIYLTPNHMVDFSEGEAVVRFNMSTFRKSGRDWIDLWITPFEDHLQLPLDDWLPDLQGEPRSGLHIRMDLQQNDSKFTAKILQNHEGTEIPTTSQGWQGYESFLTQDQRRRDVFELRISKTHIAFGMPDYNFWWHDTDIQPLDFNVGVLQFGHHSYNPTKDCAIEGACSANTWHWDDVYISPARPFTLIKALTRTADASTNGGKVEFTEPAPPDAYLRFSAIGNDLEFSIDDGVTWTAVVRQAQESSIEEHFSSYFTPIPEGISSIQLRGQDWWGGPWHARDISIWSQENESGMPVHVTPNPSGMQSTFLLGEAYPNPFNSQSSFTLSVAQEQTVSIALFDLTGKHLKSIFEGTLSPDAVHQFAIDGSGLPSGVYMYRIAGEHVVLSRPVLLIR